MATKQTQAQTAEADDPKSKAPKDDPAAKQAKRIEEAGERIAAARQELSEALAEDAAAKREGSDAALQSAEIDEQRKARDEAEAKAKKDEK